MDKDLISRCLCDLANVSGEELENNYTIVPGNTNKLAQIALVKNEPENKIVTMYIEGNNPNGFVVGTVFLYENVENGILGNYFIIIHTKNRN